MNITDKAVAQIQKELDKIGLKFEDRHKPDFPIGKAWEAGIDLTHTIVDGVEVIID